MSANGCAVKVELQLKRHGSVPLKDRVGVGESGTGGDEREKR